MLDYADFYQLEEVGLIPGTFKCVFDASRYNTVKDERNIIYQILTEVEVRYQAEIRAHPMHICRSTSLVGLETLADIDTKMMDILRGRDDHSFSNFTQR